MASSFMRTVTWVNWACNLRIDVYIRVEEYLVQYRLQEAEYRDRYREEESCRIPASGVGKYSYPVIAPATVPRPSPMPCKLLSPALVP